MPAQSGRQVIMQGMAPSGGLYVPEVIPSVDWRQYEQLSYPQLAQQVLELFLPDFDREFLAASARVYAEPVFDSENPAPLVSVGDANILELWHGPTSAFKDMALQILPRLLTYSIQKERPGTETLILTATSGDTGKAALEGFKGVSGIKIAVFYPEGGVSPVQERQMLTTGGDNTVVVAVKGNFDQCQTAVKEVFTAFAGDGAKPAGQKLLSSANSINWGRLLPQIVYYVWAYVSAVRQKIVPAGSPLNVVVPTGNFGNILAAWYAKRMGIPLGKLICASNKNNVLADFFLQGEYHSRRPFYQTMSPSMDILISSNFERFLFEMCGRDAEKINLWYAALAADGSFQVDGPTLRQCEENMYAGWADEEDVLAAIHKYYASYRYVLDPHTAVAVKVYEDYRQKTGDSQPVMIVSTASPYKFAGSVLRGMGDETPLNDWEALTRLEEKTGWRIPLNLRDLMAKPLAKSFQCRPEEIYDFVLKL
jgi:threonine synthase